MSFLKAIRSRRPILSTKRQAKPDTHGKQRSFKATAGGKTLNRIGTRIGFETKACVQGANRKL